MIKVKLSVLAVGIMMMATAAHAEVKVAYVNLQQAIQATEEGKKAKQTLEGNFEERKKKLSKMESDIKKMGEDLEKKKSILSAEVLGQKQQELQQEMLKFRELVGQSQMEMQNRERELTQPILEKMEKVIQKIAKKEKIDIVLERAQGVLWAKESLDLTDKVVQAYNAD